MTTRKMYFQVLPVGVVSSGRHVCAIPKFCAVQLLVYLRVRGVGLLTAVETALPGIVACLQKNVHFLF